MPAQDGSRGKVTDTQGPYVVGEFTVLRVGGTVALHFGTPQGRFVFHMREHQFVKHARGETDDQGKGFRTLAQIEEERRVQEQDAAGADLRRNTHNPAALSRTELAYAELVRNRALRIWEAARQFEISETTLSAWISNNRRQEWAAIRESRLAAKRGDPSDGNAPLLKPSGRIL